MKKRFSIGSCYVGTTGNIVMKCTGIWQWLAITQNKSCLSLALFSWMDDSTLGPQPRERRNIPQRPLCTAHLHGAGMSSNQRCATAHPVQSLCHAINQPRAISWNCLQRTCTWLSCVATAKYKEICICCNYKWLQNDHISSVCCSRQIKHRKGGCTNCLRISHESGK